LTRIKELSDKLLDLQAQIHPPTGKITPKRTVSSHYRFSDIITEDETMKRVIELARKAAHTTSPVMVYGETGTGKELVVQSIHYESSRRDAPFIAQNCAALPPSLLESLLFGTVRGSFTGAENRPGLFELANGGTLFLDEINSMPIELQGKLLRVIQENSIRRIGDTKTIPVHVRIITASNVNLEEAIEKGAFRVDLYYRLHVVALNIPPLRERASDIPLLTQHFLQKYNERFQRVISGIDPDVLNQFMLDQWQGNVRELEHVIEAVFNIIESDHITWDDVQLVWKGNRSRVIGKSNKLLPDFSALSLLKRMQEKSLPNYMEEVEQQLVLEALQQSNGNVQQTAVKLGIPRQTLQYKLKKFK
ncbi:MAG: sigma 54-interacting transcriptional regulator, partial [Bacilli bacterium]